MGEDQLSPEQARKARRVVAELIDQAMGDTLAFGIIRQCLSDDEAERKEGARIFAGFASGYIVEGRIDALVRLVGQIQRAADNRKAPKTPGGWADVKLQVLHFVRDHLDEGRHDIPDAGAVLQSLPKLSRRTVNEHLEELREALQAVD